MKIVYFYQYFTTPKGSYGTRVYEFAGEWIKAGHEVTVVTSLYAKSDLTASHFIEDQVINGIHVKILNIKINNKDRIIKRIWTFILYSILSSWYALTLDADVIVVSSGPITTGIPGLVAKFLRKRKLIFEVRDLWPEGAIELGIIKNKMLISLSYWLEKKCYQNAAHIITLSPGMKANIFERFGLTNITSVTNSANIELFGTKLKNVNLPVFYSTHKVAIYNGNIGMVNNSGLLLKSALLLKERNINDIMILLVGDGKERDSLALEAEKYSLDNFKILPLMPKTELVAFVQNAFVSLVPLKVTPVIDTSSPNKLFESLASGIPVIQNTQGWISRMLKENNLGFTVDGNNPGELVDVLLYLKGNPEVYGTMCNNCRAYALNNFDKTILAGKMLDAITGAVKITGKSRETIAREYEIES